MHGVGVPGSSEQSGGVVRVERTTVLPAGRLEVRCRGTWVVDEQPEQDAAVLELEAATVPVLLEPVTSSTHAVIIAPRP